MKLAPLLIDVIVLGLVFAGGGLRQRSPAVGRLLAWIAMLSSLAAPLVAAALHAPEWITAVAVLMMVVGFSGLAAALSARGPAPYGEKRGLPDGLLSEETWAQFERDFARYVAAQTRAHGAASAPPRRTRHRR